MNGFSRLTVIGGLVVAVLLMSGTSGLARQSKADADAVLKKAGLKRVDNSFVLDEELSVTRFGKQVEKLEVKVAQALKLEQDHQATLAHDQQQAQMLRDQAAMLRQQLAGAGRAGRAASSNLRSQINDLENRARQLQGGAHRDPQVQAKITQNRKDLDADQKKLQQDHTTLKHDIAKVQKQYEDLYKDKEVVEALRTLNKNARPKVALGPIAAYARHVVRQCTDELDDLGLTITKTTVHLTEEDELAKNAKAANQRLTTFKKERGTDETIRDGLAKDSGELRLKWTELKEKLAKLEQDDHIADLIAEVQKGTKAKLKLGPGPGHFQAQRDLDAIESALK